MAYKIFKLWCFNLVKAFKFWMNFKQRIDQKSHVRYLKISVYPTIFNKNYQEKITNHLDGILTTQNDEDIQLLIKALEWALTENPKIVKLYFKESCLETDELRVFFKFYRDHLLEAFANKTTGNRNDVDIENDH